MWISKRKCQDIKVYGHRSPALHSRSSNLPLDVIIPEPSLLRRQRSGSQVNHTAQILFSKFSSLGRTRSSKPSPIVLLHSSIYRPVQNVARNAFQERGRPSQLPARRFRVSTERLVLSRLARIQRLCAQLCQRPAVMDKRTSRSAQRRSGGLDYHERLRGRCQCLQYGNTPFVDPKRADSSPRCVLQKPGVNGSSFRDCHQNLRVQIHDL
jgi:hypothetical protein